MQFEGENWTFFSLNHTRNNSTRFNNAKHRLSVHKSIVFGLISLYLLAPQLGGSD